MASHPTPAGSHAREAQIIRWIVRSIVALLAIALLIYPADWLLWEARTLFGGGMSTVQVSHFTVAELKGNKEEYYPDGIRSVACSRSLFPQGGNTACWWLRRHPEVMQRY